MVKEGLAAAVAVPARLVRRRPTKLQIAVLGLVTLLSFGPIVAFLVVIGSDDGPSTQLVGGPEAPPDGVQMTATVIDVSPSVGELRVRIALQVQDELSDDGRPETDLVLRVNDVRGEDIYEFPAGELLRPVEASLALGGGSVTRYPFDRYTSVLFVGLGTESSGEAAPVFLGYDLFSNADQFEVGASSVDPDELSSVAVVELEVSRTATTTLYAVWMMILMWGLAIAGVLVVWAVTIWDVDVPVWSFTCFAGVLFALPQLRESLPGRPPPGTLLDYVAFYWSIAIVGVTLIAVLAIWVQRAHHDSGRPEGDTSRS